MLVFFAQETRKDIGRIDLSLRLENPMILLIR